MTIPPSLHYEGTPHSVLWLIPPVSPSPKPNLALLELNLICHLYHSTLGTHPTPDRPTSQGTPSRSLSPSLALTLTPNGLVLGWPLNPNPKLAAPDATFARLPPDQGSWSSHSTSGFCGRNARSTPAGFRDPEWTLACSSGLSTPGPGKTGEFQAIRITLRKIALLSLGRNPQPSEKSRSVTHTRKDDSLGAKPTSGMRQN